MLRVGYLRENKEYAKKALQKRHLPEEQLRLIDEVIAKDDERKKLQKANDDILAQINSLSKEIGDLFKSGKREEAEGLKDQVTEFKSQTNVIGANLKTTENEIEAILLNIPNIPNEKVPAGKSEEDNEVFQEYKGTLPDLGDDALAHWDLADKADLFDLKLGVKLTGSGFPVFKGAGARLQRGLINYFLDKALSKGYTEIAPPLLVNEDTARGTGQLPDKEGQMYYVEKDDLYLIPTAEVPVTNLYRNEIIQKDDFPIKLTGYTPCFRREAGSYGSDVKGLNRVHQFDKVEIVQITRPEDSYSALEGMLDHVRELLEELGLPYRILRLSGGDLGFTSAITYDFEVYSAAQKKWLEVSSVSNFETYQTNRMKIRYKNEMGKTVLAHTLNGSALALPRILASILENNQQSDGIKLPKVLLDYVGTEKILFKN